MRPILPQMHQPQQKPKRRRKRVNKSKNSIQTSQNSASPPQTHTKTTSAQADLSKSKSESSTSEEDKAQSYAHCKLLEHQLPEQCAADLPLFHGKKSLIWTFLVILKNSEVLNEDGHIVSMKVQCGLCCVASKPSPTWKYKKSG